MNKILALFIAIKIIHGLTFIQYNSIFCIISNTIYLCKYNILLLLNVISMKSFITNIHNLQRSKNFRARHPLLTNKNSLVINGLDLYCSLCSFCFCFFTYLYHENANYNAQVVKKMGVCTS